ncbi:head-tail connector protein [Photobacterium profundum]|uniref:Phage gp6-like head-tail connector protein n=1 Tax=Photobacterium profundum (strain SS9) TaxID=298386 RepID=Q6LSF7_PHOPR|nr:head-tail connector protein [Photobacterium profundum]CAG19769.1 hypothetical protein PBPRA1358 [Photobacterium profundum SS9]
MLDSVTTPISLEDMKLHLRVDHDHENVYIESLTMAAIALCEGRLFRSFTEVQAEYGYLPTPLVSWIKLATLEMYAQRRLATEKSLTMSPFSDHLLEKYIDYSKGV